VPAPRKVHITVLEAALMQVPDVHRHGTPILVRADTAGCTRESSPTPAAASRR
jgi:hypothetical protein